MNVILQSFIHNPLLKAYFLSDQHNPTQCTTKYCLCCEMDRLFAEVWETKLNTHPYLLSLFLDLFASEGTLRTLSFPPGHVDVTPRIGGVRTTRCP